MRAHSFVCAQEFSRSGSWVQLPDRQTALFHVRRDPDSAVDVAPILFLHGIPTWSFLWREVLVETRQELPSIAIDLPGFGLSDKSPRHPFHVSGIAATVEQFLDETIGVSVPFNLVVHDFGALVATELVARSAERLRAIVVTNTSFRAEKWSGAGLLRILSTPFLGDASMMLARPWMLRSAMLPFFGDPAVLTPARFGGYWYPFERGFGASLARLYREGAFEPVDFDNWRQALADFSGDALLLWGARDPAFGMDDFDDIRSLLPQSEAVAFQHAGHFLPEERPAAVGRAIRAFLTGRLGSVE